MPTAPDDWRDLLARQHGVVSRAQALACGLSSDLIRERLERGRWQPIQRGVYAVHTGPLTWHALAHAALLRVGEGAVLENLSAAYADGLADDPGQLVRVGVPHGRRVRGDLRGIRPHRTSRLPAAAHPSRTPARTRIEETVLDLVDTSHTGADAIGWLTAACQRRLTTPDRLLRASNARARERHRPLVAAVLADVALGAQSPLELAHLRTVERAHGLPPGRRQVRVSGVRVSWVDVDYPEFGLRVELDGRLGHVDDGAFRDRRRDNRSVLAGHTTLRYGFADVLGDPCGVAGEQAAVLRAHGWVGQPRRCGPDCRLPEGSSDQRFAG